MKVGDIVVLKSGGPQMTICEILEDNLIACDWFDTEFNLKNHTFYKDQLQAV